MRIYFKKQISIKLESLNEMDEFLHASTPKNEAKKKKQQQTNNILNRQMRRLKYYNAKT